MCTLNHFSLSICSKLKNCQLKTAPLKRRRTVSQTDQCCKHTLNLSTLSDRVDLQQLVDTMKSSVSEANSALEAKTEELGAKDQVILETNTQLSGAKTKVDGVYSM